MSDIQFAHAQYLYALLAVVPLACVLAYASYWLRQKARASYGQEDLVNRYTRKPRKIFEFFQLTAWVAVLALLVVAAAGPVKPATPQRAQSGSLQVIVVTDVSWSMAAEDYRPYVNHPDGTPGTAVPGPFGSRMDMVKNTVIYKVMPAVQGNQIGLVTYMGNGFPQADLTDDYTALRFVLRNWVKVGSAPGGGSDFAEGLKEALATFERDKDPNKDKVIVLFSDGGFTGDQAELAKVSQEIVAQKIRLIILGVGMAQPIPIPVYNEQGELKGYRTKEEQVVTTVLEEPALLALSQATGGQYIHLTGDDKLDIQWAITLAGSKAEPRVTHVYQYPLGAALVMLIVLFSRGLVRRKDLV